MFESSALARSSELNENAFSEIFKCEPPARLMAVTSAGAKVGAEVIGIPAAATRGRIPACLQNARRVGSVIVSILQYEPTLIFAAMSFGQPHISSLPAHFHAMSNG
jgi:hypothetical protein